MRLLTNRNTKPWALASACIEDGHVYPRIDLVRKGRFVGEPRVYRDKPQDTLAHAFEVARTIADELNVTEVH